MDKMALIEYNISPEASHRMAIFCLPGCGDTIKGLKYRPTGDSDPTILWVSPEGAICRVELEGSLPSKLYLFTEERDNEVEGLKKIVESGFGIRLEEGVPGNVII